MSIYLSNPWKPKENKIVIDEVLRMKILKDGYQIIKGLDNRIIDVLVDVFKEHHDFNEKEGGMFYSIYSQDTKYRKSIHNKITNSLNGYLEQYFTDFKVMLSSFVIKLPGPKSEFYLHQDTTGLDEWKYSPLNLWIPLQEVNINNGCLGVVPKSHAWFSPYRSISFPAPFDDIQNTVKKYLKPLEMKKGDVLFFDNRILHNSYQNQSSNARLAVVCGLFPKEAKLTTCYKPKYELEGKLELLEHKDDYLLEGKNFLIDCQKRPKTGKSLGWVEDSYEKITKATFMELCAMHKVAKTNNALSNRVNCNLIGEPIFS